jgi:hypothetical protein
MEFIQVYERKAIRFELKGVFGQSDQFKIVGDEYVIDYNFIPSTKPDSTLNWLKTHKKYKLYTLSTVSAPLDL